MKTILFSLLGLLVLVIVSILIYKEYLKRKMLKLASKKYITFKPLIEKLNDNESISEEEVLTMSRNPSLRLAVFHIMQEHNKAHLFPEEYMSCEKGAESFLVSWLEFPTELGIAPDLIEFLVKVTMQEKEVMDYYVFKFTVKQPHWAPQDWMLGLCGPYYIHSLPYDVPSRIYSRFKTLGSVTPESEVQWVHDNINK